MEEEHRLFYVGMTRAKDHLYVSYADKRILYGEIKSMTPSRFVAEIPEEHVEYSNTEQYILN